MGVLGLTPFIQRHCPEVITELPNRLRSLSGKTIAIDGTLITQRLHFAPMPCENLHILGWYRLIREFKESNVGVICVFDGEERSQAKQRETERRRMLRRTDVARGAMEVERLSRLRHLAELLKEYRTLRPAEKSQSTETLHKVVNKSQGQQSFWNTPQYMTRSLDFDVFRLANEPIDQSQTPPSCSSDIAKCSNPRKFAVPTAALLSDETIKPFEEVSQRFNPAEESHGRPTALDKAPDRAVQVSEDTAQPSEDSHVPKASPEYCIDELKLHETLPKPVENSGAFEPTISGLAAESASPEKLQPFFRENNTTPDLDISPRDVPLVGIPLSFDDTSLSQRLLSLYQEYQQSIPAFMSPPILDTPTEMTSEDLPERVQEEQVMSKYQVQLTLDEGNLWNFLVNPTTMDSLNAEEQLELLAQRSDIISKSYGKRNNPPTPKTYEESKLLLDAMGVPCIESTVPYEAEALAASLVHHGLADYVASEDTDVLIYEAPLLRNITNRQSPLTLLSGADIRQVLRLDRASFVDFALLLGTDFSQRVKNIGPHRAIKLIRAHGRIEHVIANEPKFIPRLPQDAYLEQVQIARLVFESLPPVPDLKLLQPKESDDDAVAAILERFGVHRAAMVDWDFASALDGNYFDDNPAMM